jgi:APA family basic amino acid/polyamine antiporter
MAQATEAAPKLLRELGLLDATMIVVGSMIGSGIFITSAESARTIGAPGWLLAAWALAGLLTITGALCCSELSAMMPHAGGQYVFLRRAYGPMVGFLFGWATFLVVQTGTIAAVAVAFAKFLGVFAPGVAEDRYLVAPIRVPGTSFALSLSTQQLAAIFVIVSLTALNMQGLRTGKLVQNVLTAIKTAALGALILLGLTAGVNRQSAAFNQSWWDPAANGWRAGAVEPALEGLGALALVMLLGKAMVGPLFSQTAWNNVTFTGGETRDPGRTLPRALVLGCTTVVALYLLANLAYLFTLDWPRIANAPQDRVGTALMQAILGNFGLYAMAAAIMISTFGCDNGLILAGARVYYAMARDGLFFAPAARANRHHVPAVALVAQGIWASLLTLPRTVTTAESGEITYGNVYSKLLEYVVSADLLFYTLMVFAVIVMRRKAPAESRPYRTPLYPIPPLLYVSLSVLLLLDLIYLAPETSGAGFLIVLTGIPAYFLWPGRHKASAVD